MMDDLTLEKITGSFVPAMPKAHEKSVVLGGGRVLFPCPDPEGFAKILSEHTAEVARRAYQQGKRDAKGEIRKALFD